MRPWAVSKSILPLLPMGGLDCRPQRPVSATDGTVKVNVFAGDIPTVVRVIATAAAGDGSSQQVSTFPMYPDRRQQACRTRTRSVSRSRMASLMKMDLPWTASKNHHRPHGR